MKMYQFRFHSRVFVSMTWCLEARDGVVQRKHVFVQYDKVILFHNVFTMSCALRSLVMHSLVCSCTLTSLETSSGKGLGSARSESVAC